LTASPSAYDSFEHLRFERLPDGVLLITLDRPEHYNAADERMHAELGDVWKVIDSDESVRVAVVTGAGRAFSAGGDLALVERQIDNAELTLRTQREAAAIVYNMMDCRVPIISAINGVAVGAGLAVALMADISIAGEGIRLTDGHLRLGVGAGDHAAIIWPLLCGMAKAKYYLLTSDFVSGVEAERIGLVSQVVPDEQVLDRALEVASRLARGPQMAIQGTKRTLNGWLRVASPIFESSLAQEMLLFFHQDVREGLAALREKRDPRFPSTVGAADRQPVRS
jgi:enoyl-CoA hydratase